MPRRQFFFSFFFQIIVLTRDQFLLHFFIWVSFFVYFFVVNFPILFHFIILSFATLQFMLNNFIRAMKMLFHIVLFCVCHRLFFRSNKHGRKYCRVMRLKVVRKAHGEMEMKIFIFKWKENGRKWINFMWDYPNPNIYNSMFLFDLKPETSNPFFMFFDTRISFYELRITENYADVISTALDWTNVSVNRISFIKTRRKRMGRAFQNGCTTVNIMELFVLFNWNLFVARRFLSFCQ